MKLQLVPASTGLQWVKSGVLTFFKQPLALSGLFFMFMAVSTLAGLIPVLGVVAGLALLPAATLGLMAATEQATLGKFPMPSVLFTAFKAGTERSRTMLQLGLLYAAGVLVLVVATALVDGGTFAKAYALGGKVNMQQLQAGGSEWAAVLFLALSVPLVMSFWHAPALVHWQGMGAAKSLFISFVACQQNFKAMLVFVLGWTGVITSAAVFVSVLAGSLGGSKIVGPVMVPTVLLLACMFFTSIWFSYRDSFAADPDISPP